MHWPRPFLPFRSLPGFLLAAGMAIAPQRAIADPLFAARFLSFDVGSHPRSVAVGDLNGDGKPDLVVANLQSNTVSVLLGAGGGAFAAKVDYPTGGAPQFVTMGDLNRDGKLDLVVANSTANTVSVFLGDGSGRFGARTDFGTADNPLSVAIGDVNGDGIPDMAVAD